MRDIDRLDETWDVTEAFGPMAAMHAALDRVGAGIPCGLAARFEGKTRSEVDAAICAATHRFPALRTRLAWPRSRPTLEPIETWRHDLARAADIPLTFRADRNGPTWRYVLEQDGKDVWLTAVWVHAAADGRSMLHFLATVAAALGRRPPPARMATRRRPGAPVSMIRWTPRFLVERHLPYVGLAEPRSYPPGVTWFSLPPERAEAILERARAECGGFAAWLAAAACMAFLLQNAGAEDGRVSLNLLLSRGDLEAFGGFGFAVGSLLMPVSVNRGIEIATVARGIAARQRSMMDEAWDTHLERFVGHDPARHLRFANLEARGFSAPTVNVSWKGRYPDLGGADDVRDIVCFASSRVAHVSAHTDANGLSVSLASCQAPAARESLLRRIVALVDADAPDHDLTSRTLPRGKPIPSSPPGAADGERVAEPILARGGSWPPDAPGLA